MAIRLGDEAPDFEAQTTEGSIQFHEWLGNMWGILFSHPKDFTPVCTTELGVVAKMQDDFLKRNTRVIALSVDSGGDHLAWDEDINRTQNTKVNYPIIADQDRRVAMLYDMIHPNADTPFTVRSVFFIGADKKVKAMLTYPASTGRNFNEVLRVLDSLQLTENHQVATPANWEPGADCVILPSISDDEIPEKYPKGHQVVTPYLRTTPQPDL